MDPWPKPSEVTYVKNTKYMLDDFERYLPNWGDLVRRHLYNTCAALLFEQPTVIGGVKSNKVQGTKLYCSGGCASAGWGEGCIIATLLHVHTL